MTANKTVHVLLVEDSETQALLVKTIIDRVEGLELLATAVDGVDALEYLRAEGEHGKATVPDVVLLDINMPRKDGFEVLTEMKADPKLKKIPVVMLTTSKEEEDVVKSYEHGAATFISKPIELPDLEQIFSQFANYWSCAARLPSHG